MKIAGIVLAGGQSRRMGGGDKCLRLLGGRPILSHIIDRARPQVAALALNANGDPTRFAQFGLPVVADSIPDFAGPLAGVLAGLDWAAMSVSQCSHVVSFASDAPFLPLDLVDRFVSALGDGRSSLVCAMSAGQIHPVFGLWPIELREDLRRALTQEGVRKVDIWTARHRLAVVDFPATPVDPFFNTNRPEDLDQAEMLAPLASSSGVGGRRR
jgi:molybdopterin-guanine dinucleotide biosynthesis protein A